MTRKKHGILYRLFHSNLSKEISPWMKSQSKAMASGGNAIVYLVHKKGTDTHYVLKRLDPIKRTKEKTTRFLEEIDVVRKNSSSIKGILPIIDYNKRHYWYVMPVAEMVIKHIQKNDNVEDIIDGTIQLCDTLIELHNKGITHRDIKPNNIFFYNNRFTLGDFGLVNSPITENITRSDFPLGAIFTIAPEMRRNPKNADFKKADVYSLAKTLWMFLTLDEKGFEGQYSFVDDTHRLHSNKKYDTTYLVEIEELLAIATENDPEKRPTIEEFKLALETWKRVFNDKEQCQINEWRFLNRLLFGEVKVSSIRIVDIESIIYTLNVLSRLPVMNHMMVSTGGGLDLDGAEPAAESGCMFLINNPFYTLVKPKCLYYETFDDVRWNYFLLETEEMPVVVGSEITRNEERVVEDYPGHYVSAVDACYKVYDYDTGKPLPSGSRVIYRCLKGKFLVVLKRGPYNQISSTYDGRHGNCTAAEFREYIDTLSTTIKQVVDEGEPEEMVLGSSFPNPFDNKEWQRNTPFEESPLLLPDGTDYVRSHYLEWRFEKQIEKKPSDNDVFRFYFELKGLDDSLICELISKTTYCLDDNGFIKQFEKNGLIISNAFYTTDREEALVLCERLNDHLSSLADGYDIRTKVYFQICWRRTGKPTHLFTKKEMEKIMRDADDREGNRLVIDENGYSRMISTTIPRYLFPVSHEAYEARNNYVGKYADLSILEQEYHCSLDAWKKHLLSGKHISCDDVVFINNEKEIIDEILDLMKGKEGL